MDKIYSKGSDGEDSKQYIKGRTRTAIQSVGVALPIPLTELVKNTINLLCFSLEVKFGT